MANIDHALVTRLNAQVASVSSRVWKLVLPQNPTYPALTFQKVSAPRVSAFGSDPGVVESRYQVDSWDEDSDQVFDTAEEVRAALQRFSGTVSSVEILDVYLENERELYEDTERLFRVSQDYIVWYRE